MDITQATILNTLGPVGINWDFEEIRTLSSRGRSRSLVKVSVKKTLLEDTQVIGAPRSFERLSIDIWGTSDANEPAEVGVHRAVCHGLMLFGLLPELAEAYGLNDALERLGPIGLHWGYDGFRAYKTPSGKMRCEIEIELAKRIVFRDESAKGEMKRAVSAEVPVSSRFPEDDALFAAIRNGCAWAGLLPEDECVMMDYDYKEPKVPTLEKAQRMPLHRRAMCAAAASIAAIFTSAS